MHHQHLSPPPPPHSRPRAPYKRGGGGGDGLWSEARGQEKQSNDHIQHSPSTPATGLRKSGNDTSRSTGRSGRQNAATRRNMRREERVTVQGPVKEQQPDGMSHGGLGWGDTLQRLSGGALSAARAQCNYLGVRTY